jgi:hypothetical protein
MLLEFRQATYEAAAITAGWDRAVLGPPLEVTIADICTHRDTVAEAVP